MVAAEGRRAGGSRVSPAAQALLRVLTRKPFFEHRFLGQVQELFGHSSAISATDITASLWLNSLFDRVPGELRDKVGSRACAALVDHYDACPTPTEIRTLLCDVLLSVQQLAAVGLIERAQTFFSCPPTNQDIADRWVERVIFTTVSRMGREHFTTVSVDEWKRALCDTIFGDETSLKSYQVLVIPPLQTSPRNLRSLVSHHG